MEVNPQHVFRLGTVALTAYLAWSAIGAAGGWQGEQPDTARGPEVRPALAPDDLDLAAVNDPFPWPQDEAARSHGSGEKPLQLSRAGGAPTVEVEGVFLASGAHRVLVDGTWLGEGESHRGLTVVTIRSDTITFQAGDVQVSVPVAEPDLRLY